MYHMYYHPFDFSFLSVSSSRRIAAHSAPTSLAWPALFRYRFLLLLALLLLSPFSVFHLLLCTCSHLTPTQWFRLLSHVTYLPCSLQFYLHRYASAFSSIFVFSFNSVFSETCSTLASRFLVALYLLLLSPFLFVLLVYCYPL